jgi:hypothetical protein
VLSDTIQAIEQGAEFADVPPGICDYPYRDSLISQEGKNFGARSMFYTSFPPNRRPVWDLYKKQVRLLTSSKMPHQTAL